MNKDKPKTDETTEKQVGNEAENTVTEQKEGNVPEEKHEREPSELLFSAILKNPKVAIFIGHILNGENPGEAATKAFEIRTPLISISTEEIASLIKSDDIDEETKTATAQRIGTMLADADSNRADIVSLIAKGLNFENAIEKNYIKGRNEKIETEDRKSLNPIRDEEPPHPENCTFLKNPRKSIWDY